MSAPSNIIDLRAYLEEKYPERARKPQRAFSTGLAALDDSLSGGLPVGAISEITLASGGGLLVRALLQRVRQAGTFLALIDGRDSFDSAGVPAGDLRRLLLVRCRSASQAVQAADLLLRDGNLPLIILDLIANSPAELRKIPSTTWYRLQRVVEPVSSALLVLTSQSLVSSAQVKLSLESAFSLRDLDRRQSELVNRLAASARNVTRERFRRFA